MSRRESALVLALGLSYRRPTLDGYHLEPDVPSPRNSLAPRRLIASLALLTFSATSSACWTATTRPDSDAAGNLVTVDSRHDLRLHAEPNTEGNWAVRLEDYQIRWESLETTRTECRLEQRRRFRLGYTVSTVAFVAGMITFPGYIFNGRTSRNGGDYSIGEDAVGATSAVLGGLGLIATGAVDLAHPRGGYEPFGCRDEIHHSHPRETAGSEFLTGFSARWVAADGGGGEVESVDGVAVVPGRASRVTAVLNDVALAERSLE